MVAAAAGGAAAAAARTFGLTAPPISWLNWSDVGALTTGWTAEAAPAPADCWCSKAAAAAAAVAPALPTPVVRASLRPVAGMEPGTQVKD